MNSDRQKEIARKGGQAAHKKGTAHEFTSEEARAAGRKGGERVSADRHHMSRIGRLGGKSSAGRRQPGKPDDEAASATGQSEGGEADVAPSESAHTTGSRDNGSPAHIARNKEMSRAESEPAGVSN